MKLVILCLSIITAGLVARAEDKSSGCGLGWKVAPRTSILSSYTRSLTNATTSSTFGMTSGTSGCDNHSIVSNEKQQIHYAEVNYHNLMVEMSQGNGEFLKGFALVMGCSEANINDFTQTAQKNYNNLFPATNAQPSQLVNSMRDVMYSNNVCGTHSI